MVKNKQVIYIYLARRDSKGIRILMRTTGPRIGNSRLPSLKSLALPFHIQESLESDIKENRLMWEPFICSATSFQDFLSMLKKQGFKNLPSNELGEINLSHRIKTPAKSKSMLRKKVN